MSSADSQQLPTLERNEVAICQHRDWRRHFGQPEGFAGRLAGRVMALKNAPMHRLAVHRMDVRTDDRILEIGFGHGRMTHMLAERASTGFVAGIDPSAVMVRQATSHCRRQVASGNVELVEGSVASLPWENGCFNKVCAVNSYQHWPDPAENLVEVRRVLEPGGLVLLCLRMEAPASGRLSSPGFSLAQVDCVAEALTHAGFGEVRRQLHDAGRQVACVTAFS